MDRIKEPQSVTIRVPATANLMLDSADRSVGNNPTPFDFQINKSNSIFNGFFNRIATSEVVLEWNVPNVSPALSNNVLNWTVEGTSTFSTTVEAGTYNVAEALDAVAYAMSLKVNTLSTLAGSPPYIISTIGIASPGIGIRSADLTNFSFSTATSQANALPSTLFRNYTSGTAGNQAKESIDLRPFRYMDFVSAQLTYNQDLKDSSTASNVRDVLNRWYFADDQPNATDKYGYPIYQGTQPFRQRRTYNPPKQIRWDSTQPLGNLTFQVYDDSGNLMSYLGNGSNTNWLMTLQVSEN
jgi:hypothetical protein